MRVKILSLMLRIWFAAPDGSKYSGVFKRWDGDRALFDFNHPLSGVDLKVDVEILGVM